jgi:hypothetical protein
MAVPDHEVMLFGGLGNQLFQVAFGQYLKSVSGRAVHFAALGTVSTADVEALTGIPVTRRLRGLNALGALRLPHALAQRASGRVVRVDMQMSAWVAPRQADQAACWCGYWQVPSYLSHVEAWVDDVAGSVRAHESDLMIADRPHVALHVRRGDYVGLVPMLSGDYYGRAFEAICRARELDPTTTPALLVSNDPDWARANVALPTSNVVVTAGTALDDLGSLSCADGIVMSHSTFSWWAARLSGPSAAVVAPRPWRLGTGGADDGAILRLPDWLSVQASYDE